MTKTSQYEKLVKMIKGLNMSKADIKDTLNLLKAYAKIASANNQATKDLNLILKVITPAKLAQIEKTHRFSDKKNLSINNDALEEYTLDVAKGYKPYYEINKGKGAQL